MKFEDQFSKQSELYKRYRPGYPDELFQFLFDVCKDHELVWDCATGNGQAAIQLTPYFKKIIASDASTEQLSHASPHEQITSKHCAAEKIDLMDNSSNICSLV